MGHRAASPLSPRAARSPRRRPLGGRSQDLLGYVVVENALSEEEVRRLNAEIDRAAEEAGGLQEYPRRLSGEGEGGALTALAGDPSLDPEGKPEGRHRMDLGGMLSWEQPHCEPFRERDTHTTTTREGPPGFTEPVRCWAAVLCHDSVKPYLDGVLGEGYRLDHGPGLIAMEPGAEGGTLHHGAGNIVDFTFGYKFTPGGKIRTGLTVVEYLLADEGPGDGGFAVIAGSRACSAALLLPPAAALTNSSSPRQSQPAHAQDAQPDGRPHARRHRGLRQSRRRREPPPPSLLCARLLPV